MKTLFLFISLTGLNCWSAELNCEIKLNTKSIIVNQLKTQLNIKSSIGERSGITAYITEKESGLFLIEAYLLDYDIRIYSEGPLPLTASLWGRESMVDISCRPISAL